jgi:hypothetical protein
MNAFLKQTGQKWLDWAVKNPKKFFTYSMLFLSVSFVISMIQGIFFPSETAFKIKPPILYSKNQTTQNTVADREKEMEKIVTELKALKVKRDSHALQKEDSLRIEYLFNQFQKLKNGH